MADETLTLSPTTTAYGPLFVIALLCAGAAAVIYVHWRRDRSLDIPAALWAVTFAAPLAVVAAWASMGMLSCDNTTVNALVDTTLIGGLVCLLLRRFVFLWIDGRDVVSGNIIASIRDFILIAAVAVLSVVSLEIACNNNLPNIPSNSLAFSIGFVAVLLLIIYFIGQRHGGPMIIVPLTCCIFGIAEYFVTSFKGEAILPSDILALGTAMEVSEGYTFVFPQQIVTSLTLLEVSFLLLSLIRPYKIDRSHLLVGVGANLGIAILAAAVAFAGFGSMDIDEALGFSMDQWMPINTYINEGFITSFATMVNKLPIEKPDGYTTDNAEKLQTELARSYDEAAGSTERRAAAVAQFNELKPAVVTIMNESFSDLSCFESLQAAGYTGPAFYNSLPDTLVRGTMLSSVTGGGTANSEFEFLTGNSMAFVGVGKIAYQMYQLAGVDSLAKDLGELGYAIYAMHPQNPVNYRRDQVYRQLGFDEFLSINDFEGAPSYHAGVTDRATYDKILDLLRSDASPQFLFDVTMQNHGGYDAGTVPAEDMTDYVIDGVDETTLTQLNTYLACIDASDRDLEYFIAQLRDIGRPVVLIFFGDHQPSVSSTLNDQLYPDEDAAEHAYRTYQSTYFIWANYEVAGTQDLNVHDNMGANEIAATALDKIGAPLTDYQKALLSTREEVPTINVAGYLGADGLRYDLQLTDGPYLSTIDALRRIEYLNFAAKVQ